MKNAKLVSAVERTAKGENEAFAQIYGHFERPVYYLALRITKNESDAGDVLQETMLNLYKSLRSLQDPSKLGSYVMRIAYHCSLKVLKGGGPDLTEEEVLEQVPDADARFSPESYVETREQQETILDMIDQLSEGQRAVITLFYYQSLSVREIADILEVSESVVKTRLSRGRDSLRQTMSRHKGALAAFVAILLLPRSLRTNALAACSPTVREANWQALCSEIGFSGELAASPPAMPRWPRYGGSRAVSGFAVAASGAATAVVAAAIATAVALQPQPVSGSVAEPAVAGVSVGQGQTAAETGSIADDIEILEIEEGEDRILLDGRDFVIPQDASPVSARSDSSGGESEPSGQSDNDSGESFFQVPRYLLTCSKGQPLTEKEILQKAGVSLTRPATISLQYYSQIDFSTPGEYGVYLQATDAERHTSPRIGIIIIVEG